MLISINQEGTTEYDHLVYLRVTEACNLHCDHCFIPNNPKSLSENKLIESLDKLIEAIAPQSHIHFQLHGGEPTLIGWERLSEQCDLILNKLSAYKISFGMQTNLMKVDDACIDFIKKYTGNLCGVSWDYQIRHARKGKTLSNKRYEEIFFPNLQFILSKGVEVTLVITTTKPFFERFRNGDDFFEFLLSLGIKYCHLEKLTPTGYAKENWPNIGLSNKEYSDYMSNLFMAYRRWTLKSAFDNKLYVSPFDGLINSLADLGGAGGYGCYSGKCDSSFHTISADGYQTGCTALTSENALFENRDDSIVKLINFKDIGNVRTKRTANCANCKFNMVCNTGCMAAPVIDHSDECSGNFKLLNIIYLYGKGVL